MMRLLLLMVLAVLATAVAAEELRVGMETRTPPWSFIPGIDYSREDFTRNPRTTIAQLDKLTGIDVEVAAALGRRLGATIRIVPFAWFDLEEGLLAGQFDLILNAWTRSPKTPASILDSTSYYEWGLLIAVRQADAATRSFQDLSGRKVGHYPDPTVERSLRALGQVQLVERDSPEALFEDLRASTLDAVVFDSPYVQWRVSQDSSFRVVGERLNKLGYHVGVRRSERLLFERVEAAIKALQASGELAKIQKRWDTPSSR